MNLSLWMSLGSAAVDLDELEVDIGLGSDASNRPSWIFAFYDVILVCGK